MKQIIAQLCNPRSTDPHRMELLDLFIRLHDPSLGDLV